MNKPNIYRKRFIPPETVDISKDLILFRSDELIVTRWNSIKPRPDFSWGISFAFLKEGYKISRFYDSQGKFIYWYCDIIEVSHDEKADTYIFTDLLLDVKVMPDGKVVVLDADELAEALEKGLVTTEQACFSLRCLDKLLAMINKGCFPPAVCIERDWNAEL